MGLVQFPADCTHKIVDIQYGRHHVLARTDTGKVYAWGGNPDGQLGLNHVNTVYEPTFVEELKQSFVIQILAVDNMSYALTREGVVYAWGDNKDGTLGLDHNTQKVTKP